MLAQVAFDVGVVCQKGPAGNWDNESQTRGGQTEQDPDPNGDGHSGEHPDEARGIMSFVNVTQTGNDREQGSNLVFCAYHLPILRD